jgi:cellulose synthase (UDP-forming)
MAVTSPTIRPRAAGKRIATAKPARSGDDRRSGARDRRVRPSVTAGTGWSPLERRQRPVGYDRRSRAWRHRRSSRYLRDALTLRQRRTLCVLIAAWLGAVALALHWWLEPSHLGALAAAAVNTMLLVIDAVALPGWFLTWIWRMRRPDPSAPVPELATAMIVTKAPSEPWPVVRATLEAMLGQDFPYDYDVWLADERPTRATYRWCRERGVMISNRHGVAAYHRREWPRRTRCKEGNLAFFYDHRGYDCYDVVAQLDADHVPAPDYLRHMVAPFRDPHVGYVAAPSICDRNADESWSARLRLHAEAVFHGPLQAGHSGGGAPSMIGSHYAVRTVALKEIGGLGPELAEDFTTTLMMSSYRWQGVFAVDARAHGDGPQTINDFATQEFQWSRSMMNVLLHINTRYWRTLSRAAKLRLGFCQLWYPLIALTMLASVLVPVASIATRTPPMHVSLGAFYAHFGPALLVLVAILFWLRHLAWLRPSNAKPVGWELIMFQLVRWPWVVLGCLHALIARITGCNPDFKVTPKGASGPAPLGLPTVAPYLLLATVAASPVILHLNAGAASGYFILTLINTGLYLGTALLIVVLHLRDQPRSLKLLALRLAGRTVVAASVMTATIAGSVGAALPSVLHFGSDVPPLRPWPASVSFAPRLELGVSTESLAINSYRAWQPAALREINSFEHAARAHAAIVMWFADWQHVPAPNLAQLHAVASRGSVPEISWEPWDSAVPLGHSQPRYTLASIIDGAHDAYIRRWAAALRSYGRPVLLRFAQEMNGSWYPWSEAINGNRPGEFVEAWRHVHDIFTAAGATNVRWIWSPVARFGVSSKTIVPFYPGSAYVDVIGLSGFNGGTSLNWTGWRTFGSLFDTYLAEAGQLAPNKPMQISEVASAIHGGSRAQWILNMFADLRDHPQVASVLWFDVDKQTNWTIAAGSRDAVALAGGLRLASVPLAPVAPAPPDFAAIPHLTTRPADPLSYSCRRTSHPTRRRIC